MVTTKFSSRNCQILRAIRLDANSPVYRQAVIIRNKHGAAAAAEYAANALFVAGPVRDQAVEAYLLGCRAPRSIIE